MPTLYKCEKKQKPLPSKIDKNKKENGGKKKSPPPPKKKLNFKNCKKNTLNSLNEVEHFLRNFKKCSNYIKLYKILR